MRIYKNKPFARFARKSGLSDVDLCGAVRDAIHGLIDADLGGGLIKQRIARSGAGKSGGFRTLIVFRAGDLAIFIHGFAKSDVDNMSPDELIALKKLAAEMLAYGRCELAKAVESGTLLEVNGYGEGEAIS